MTDQKYHSSNLYLVAFLGMQGIKPISERFDSTSGQVVFSFEDSTHLRAVRTNYWASEFSQFVACFQEIKERAFSLINKRGR